jgi:hypothetical protein
MPRAALDLGALHTAPGCARAWTRVILREWKLMEAGRLVGRGRGHRLRTSHERADGLPARGGRRPPVILIPGRAEFAILVRDFATGQPARWTRTQAVKVPIQYGSSSGS